MAICCCVCGEWVPSVGPDRLDICADCMTLNFPAVQDQHDPGPPAPAPAPGARAALEAFVDTAHPLTPREVEAMRRMAEAWRLQEDA